MMRSLFYASVCVLLFTFVSVASVDLTTPTGGTITYSSSHSSFPGTKAFDDESPMTSAGRWLTYATTMPNAYVTYAFNGGATHVVSAYKVWNFVQYSVETRAPRDFNLQGSSNGVDWVVLDTRSGETGWGAGEGRSYIFTNSVPYSHFKFTIVADNGATDYTGVSELELFESIQEDQPPAQATATYPTDGATGVSISKSLEWGGDILADAHNLYFGTNAVLSEADFVTNTTDTLCDVGLREFGATYFWRVDSSNQFGVTTGEVWSFTSRLPDPEFAAYDGFEDYTPGLLNGQGSAGGGWTIPWVAYTTAVEVVAESLSYKSGDVEVNGGTQAVQIVGIDRQDAMRRIFTGLEGPVVYFSALVQRRTPISGDHMLSVALKDQTLGSASDHTAGFDFGYPDGEINAELHSTIQTRSRVSSGVSVVSNQTFFIVTRLSRYGDDQHYESSEILVNPSTSTEPETGWTQATLESVKSSILDKINVRTYFLSGNDTELLDEIRIGTTYESVVPKRMLTGSLIMIL